MGDGDLRLIWYVGFVIPTFFVDMAQTQKVLTGSIVGGMTVIMLILNFVMIGGFLKNWKTKAA